jgi:hypothetical protein
LNSVTGTFGNPASYAAGQQPYAVALADINGDGNLDIVVANRVATGTVSILFGDGNGGFSAPSTIPTGGAYPQALALADFNGDGSTDIAVANGSSSNVSLILLNNKLTFSSANNNWTDLNTAGLATIQANSVAMSPSSRDQALVVSQDNGFAQTSNATVAPTNWPTWNARFGGDGVEVRYDTSQVNSAAYAAQQYGSFYRSDDGGATWSYKGGNGTNGMPVAGSTNYPFYSKFAVYPGDTKRVLLGSYTQLYESVDRGENWSTVGGALPAANSGISALAYAPSDNQTIYLGFNNGQIYLTRDHGATPWNPVPLPGGITAPITSIVVDPQDPQTVYVSVGAFDVSKVFVSNNSGVTWSAITTGLPNVPVNALLLTGHNGTLFAGNDDGVYSTATGTIAWSRYATGLPHVQVRDLQLQQYGTTTYLSAATYGRGVWTIDPALRSSGDGRKREDSEALVRRPTDLADDNAVGAVDEPSTRTFPGDTASDPFLNAALTGNFNGQLFSTMPGLATETEAAAGATGPQAFGPNGVAGLDRFFADWLEQLPEQAGGPGLAPVWSNPTQTDQQDSSATSDMPKGMDVLGFPGLLLS